MEINGLVCGTGGKDIPLPSDPDNNLILTASTAYGGIALRWTLPSRNAHAVAHIHVFRNPTNDFATATNIGTTGGNYYFDSIITDTPKEYYYWIQVVSLRGTLGEPIGGVIGVAKPLSKDLVDILSGKINSGILAAELQQKIAKIEDLKNGITEIKEYATNESESLGKVMLALKTTLDDSSAIIKNEIDANSLKNKALASQINTVQASLKNDIASVQTQSKADIDSVTNKMNALWTAKVDVNGNVGGFGLVGTEDTVEAGFDVDRFWVGRNTHKTKPFIIENDIVYMNEVVIKNGTIKSAHIGSLEVDTSNIKNQAVTDYSEFEISTSSHSSGSTLATFTLKEDGYILIYFLNTLEYSYEITSYSWGPSSRGIPPNTVIGLSLVNKGKTHLMYFSSQTTRYINGTSDNAGAPTTSLTRFKHIPLAAGIADMEKGTHSIKLYKEFPRNYPLKGTLLIISGYK